MRNRSIKPALAAALAALFIFASAARAQYAIGTAFTYEGTLKFQGTPANGKHDFEFRLYDSPENGTLIGTNALADLLVQGGRFVAMLDYGPDVFTGNARWLEIAVRPGNGAGGDYTTLSPRQELKPVPYAMHAATADRAMIAAPASKLTRDFILAPGETVAKGMVVGLRDGELVRGYRYDDFPKFPFTDGAKLHYGAIHAAALSTTKFVAAFHSWEAGTTPGVVVGELSGDALSYGAVVPFPSSLRLREFGLAALDETRFVLAAAGAPPVGGQDRIELHLGTVSGNGIAFGSPTEVGKYLLALGQLGDGKFAVAYFGLENGVWASRIAVGQEQGGGIALGAGAEFTQLSSGYFTITALTPSKLVALFRGPESHLPVSAVVGDIAGNAITFGAPVPLESSIGYSHAMARLSDSRVAIGYVRADANVRATALVGDVAGSSITFGPEYEFAPRTVSQLALAPLGPDRFGLLTTERHFDDALALGPGVGAVAQASGQDISFGPEFVFTHSFAHPIAAVGLGSSSIVALFGDAASARLGMSSLIQPPTQAITPIGVAQNYAFGGQAVSVVTDGTSDAHSGLEPGRFYYVQPSGNLTSNFTDVPAGIALSPTDLLLRGEFGQPQR